MGKIRDRLVDSKSHTWDRSSKSNHELLKTTFTFLYLESIRWWFIWMIIELRKRKRVKFIEEVRHLLDNFCRSEEGDSYEGYRGRQMWSWMMWSESGSTGD